MKRVTLLAAAVVLVATNAWTLVAVFQNRTDERGGRLELSERELRLPRDSGESTAISLELTWRTSADPQENRGAAPWLDTTKLTELGFDCSVPATQPDARDHYRAQTTALVFLVLALQDPANGQTGPGRGLRTRLVAVDAGRDPARLRAKYSDATRHILTRGLVRLVYRDRAERSGEPLVPPRVEGRIGAVLPGQIFVAPPFNQTLAALRRRADSDRDAPDGEARYAVSVSWGANYEPWITGLRLLPGPGRATAAP